MRHRIVNIFAPVLMGGFAGLSCLTNLYAQDVMVLDSICCDRHGQAYQGPNPLSPADCPAEAYCGPFVYFQTDYLFWTRDSSLQSGPIIGGPDTFSFNDLSTGYEGGYRLKAALALETVEFEFTWAEIDGWGDTLSGQLTNGVGFDTGASFAGANFINQTTFFQSIFNAASITLPGADETLEDEGLGPVAAFADLPPSFQAEYRSSLSDMEVMAKFAPFQSRIKLGMGWRHVTLDELARATLTGTFRAVDNNPGANGGLSHAALVNPLGGNLTPISGAGDGFDDETGLLGGVGPDLLQLQHLATTDNTLNGVQFSLEALLIEGEWLLLDGFLKAGVYHNDAQGRLTETYSGIANDNSVYGRDLTATGSSVAFVGQVGLGTTYRVNDYLRLRAGWEVLFLSGVALAPDQVANPLAGSYLLNNDGDLVANGGYVGLELTF
ncbi:MAG: hypothetical protein KDA76_04110 [Planctomycetaceae bacterium]|nr:hypothetical protein [Planctomycetaceae bacterium]